MKQPTRRKEARARRAARRGGQALVELALVLLILVMLTAGIVQFGIIYSATIQLTNLAREGARFAAIHGTDTNVPALTQDYMQKHAAGTTIRPTQIPDANISVTINGVAPNTSNANPGNPITVVLTYDMTSKFFLPVTGFGALANTNNRWSQFKQQATMTIE